MHASSCRREASGSKAGGCRRSGDLWAWGEWEAQSQLVRRLRRPDTLTHPECLWRPCYTIPNGGWEGLHNTDPFIFGERILYSNCKQASSPCLRSLDRGSVIAFGSRKAGQWVLDTVLVVADFIDYAIASARSDLEGLVPEAFLDVTGGPLEDNHRDATCAPAPHTRNRCGGPRAGHGPDVTLRLYRGATPEDSVPWNVQLLSGDARWQRHGIPTASSRTARVVLQHETATWPQAVVRPG